MVCLISGFNTNQEACRFEQALKKCYSAPVSRSVIMANNLNNVHRKILAAFSVAGSVWWKTKAEEKKKNKPKVLFAPPKLTIEVHQAATKQIGDAIFETCAKGIRSLGCQVDGTKESVSGG